MAQRSRLWACPQRDGRQAGTGGERATRTFTDTPLTAAGRQERPTRPWTGGRTGTTDRAEAHSGASSGLHEEGRSDACCSKRAPCWFSRTLGTSTARTRCRGKPARRRRTNTDRVAPRLSGAGAVAVERRSRWGRGTARRVNVYGDGGSVWEDGTSWRRWQ